MRGLALEVNADAIQSQIQKAVGGRRYYVTLNPADLRKQVEDALHASMTQKQWSINVDTDLLKGSVTKALTGMEVLINHEALTTQVRLAVADGLKGHTLNVTTTVTQAPAAAPAAAPAPALAAAAVAAGAATGPLERSGGPRGSRGRSFRDDSGITYSWRETMDARLAALAIDAGQAGKLDKEISAKTEADRYAAYWDRVARETKAATAANAALQAELDGIAASHAKSAADRLKLEQDLSAKTEADRYALYWERVAREIKAAKAANASLQSQLDGMAVEARAQAAARQKASDQALRDILPNRATFEAGQVAQQVEAARAEKMRLGGIYNAAKFGAAGQYEGQWTKVAGAKALVDTVGPQQATAFLGTEGYLVKLVPALEAHAKAARTAAGSTSHFTATMQDAHSAARGLAGSLGQMWLTWGNTVPLAAAAALGSTMRSVVENGKAVEYQLGFVSALTHEATMSIDAFNGALAGSLVAPVQAAEALRGLAQNGLNTREAMAALPTVLSLATAGELSLSEAALGATGVLAAFNLGIDQVGRVSDVFTKAAAMSNTSVGGMVEAMKQASTVSDQFGVSLEQTAAVLAVMAKRNIEGSAAGTAFRNMMRELATPTKGAREAMAELGLQVFDNQGKLKDFNAVLEEVKLKTQDLNEKSRLAFLDKIFGERGGKAANAVLTDLALYKDTLRQLQDESAGFTKSVEDALKDTTQGRIRTLTSEFQVSTSSAFVGAKTAVDTFLLSLTNSFASDAFKTTATSITTVAANLATSLLDHADKIAIVAGGWVALRASMMIWVQMATTIPAIMARIAAAGAAVDAALAAGTASAGAMSLVGSMLGPLAIAAGVAAAAYYLLADRTSEVTRKQREMTEALEASGRAMDKQLTDLNNRNEYLARYNFLRSQGMSRDQAEAAAGGSADVLAKQKEYDKQKALVAALEARANKTEVNVTWGSGMPVPTDDAVAAEKELATARANLAEMARQLDGARRLAEATRLNTVQAGQEKNLQDIRDFNERVRSFAERNPKVKVPVELTVDERDAMSTSEVVAKILKSHGEEFNKLLTNKNLPSKAKDDEAEAKRRAEEVRQRMKGELEERQRMLDELLRMQQRHGATELKLVEGQHLAGLLEEEDYLRRRGALQEQGTLQKASYFQSKSKLTGQTLFDLLGEEDAKKAESLFNPNNLANGSYESSSGDATGLYTVVERALKTRGKSSDAAAVKDVIRLLSEKQKDTNEIKQLGTDLQVGRMEVATQLNALAEKQTKDFVSLLNKADTLQVKLADQAMKGASLVGLTPLQRARAEAAAAVQEIEDRLRQATADIEAARGKFEDDRQFYRAVSNSKREMATALEARAATVDSTDTESATALRKQAADLRAEADRANERALQASIRAQALQDRLDSIQSSSAKIKENAKAKPGDELIDKFLNEKDDPIRGMDKQAKALFGIEDAYTRLTERAERYAAARELAFGRPEVLARLQDKQTASELRSYAAMASAAKGLFDTKSKGYKVLKGVEDAYHAYEMAMAIKTAMTKIFWSNGVVAARVAGDAVATASSTTSTATGVADAYMLGTAYAAAGVAKQASGGDPYSAIPRMLMMAAAMAALGFATGAFGGGGGGAPASNEGTGTVLGNPTAKSESISKALSKLGDVDTMTMKYSAQMLNSLRNIEASLKGVSSLIVRSGGIQAAVTGLKVGFDRNDIGTFMGGWLGDILGESGTILGDAARRTGNLFGSRTSVIGQGIVSGPQTVAQIRQSGINAGYYAVTRETGKFLGISTGSSTNERDLGKDANLSRQFTNIINTFTTTLEAAAGALGQSVSDVDSKMNSFVVDLNHIDLMGLTGEEISTKLSDVFSAMGDNLATAALGGFEDFAQVGEGYLNTVIRVASSTESAQRALRRLGVQAVSLTSIINKQGDVEAEQIRQSLVAFEGVSSVGKIIDQLDLSGADMVKVYRSLTDVRLAFRKLGISGEAVTADLISGAGSLDDLTSSLATFEDKFLSAPEKLSLQYARVKASFDRLGLGVPKTAADFVKLVRGIDASTAAGQEMLGNVLALSDAFYGMDQAMQELGKTIEDEIARIHESMVPQDRQGLAYYQAQFATKTAAARAGDTAALDALPDLSQAMLKLAESSLSYLDLRRLQAATAASLQATLRMVRSVVTESPLGSQTVPGFASGGHHSGGWRVVGERGMELEATGPAQIFNAQDTAEILGGARAGRGEHTEELLASQEAMLEELAMLRQEQKEQAARIESLMARSTRILERVGSNDKFAVSISR